MNLKEFYNQIGDYESAIERFGGNEKMLSKFIKRFPADKTYGDLVQAYNQNDDTSVYRFALTLYEVCGSLAFTEMGKTAGIIVEAYRTSETVTRGIMNISMLMNTLAEQYDTLVEAIKDMRL